MSFLRALGCKSAITNRSNPTGLYDAQQNPYQALSVFGYFAPNHKAPESLTPAPEQKLLTSDEFNQRAGNFSWQAGEPSNFKNAGCELDLFAQAAAKSDDDLIALISERFFKGAMPPTLLAGARNLLKTNLASETPFNKFTRLLQVLLTSPTFGVVK
jgi:hypothetical protein